MADSAFKHARLLACSLPPPLEASARLTGALLEAQLWRGTELPLRSASACRLVTSSLSLARSSSSWLLWLWKAWHLCRSRQDQPE